MRQLMITIVAGVCLCAVAGEEGHDLKSLVRPQAFSCELRDVRLTRAIDEMSSGTVTINRGSEAITAKHTQSGSLKGTMESSSENVTAHHKGHDVRDGGKLHAEGGLKWGIIPYGSVGGGVSHENSKEVHRVNDSRNSNKSGTEVSVTDVREGTVSSGRENLVEDSVKSRLGGYKLAFSVVLKNQDVNDELQIDSSRMYAKLRGPGLTGVISVPCSEQGEFTLGAEEKSFEFVYPINDERMLNELIRLDESGQLGQLALSRTGADIPVVSKKSGKSILSEQSAIERRNPSTAVSIEFGELQELPSWRVSRRHTAKSGRRGTFVTLREALQGIGLLALEFGDSLPEQIFEFSKNGSLAKVLDSEMLKEMDDGHYQVLALRLKDYKGTTSLALPLSGKLDLTIADYSEIAIIAFTFDEFAEWAVQFPSHFSSLEKEIERWLAVVDTKALSAFKKTIDEAKRREEAKKQEEAKRREEVKRQEEVKRREEAKQQEDDVKPLPTDGTLITEDDVARFRARANAGVPEMQAKYARCLFNGWGIAKDEVEAVKWFRKAVDHDNADGQVGLGNCYLKGIVVAKDEAEAIKWYRKAVLQGNAWGQVNLGACYLDGVGVAKDEMEAVKLFRKAVGQGDAGGQVGLGYCYLDGIGVAKDETEAAKLFRKAAAQGLASGQFLLGYCYANGKGVAKDEVEAVRWYRKAAEQGNTDGQVKLGDCYLKGVGVAKDGSEAVKWYRKAVEQGNAPGQVNLGDCYLKGIGVAKDDAEAVKWYRKAAEQGNAPGQVNLGFCYEYGKGVAKDEVEAVRCYRTAAEQGDTRGQVFLGLCYEYGTGVAKDRSEAVRWYRKAAAQGSEDAIRKLRELGME